MDPLTITSYSIQDYVEMPYLYGKNNNNASKTTKEFNNWHGSNLSHKIVSEVHRWLLETSCVFWQRCKIGISEERIQEIDDVERSMEENPTRSLRNIAVLEGVWSRSSAHRALWFAGLQLFHATPIQNLEEGDPLQWRHLACWFLDYEDLLERILFTNEAAQFMSESVVNSQNYQIRS